MGRKCQVIGCMEGVLQTAFTKYSHPISRHPLPFIIVPIIVSIGLAVGMMRMNYVYDTEYLYTPRSSSAKVNQARLKELFPNDGSQFFIATRKLDEEGFIRVIVTHDSGNVYTEEGLHVLHWVDEQIKTYKTKEHNLTYADLCARWENSCYENEIVRISRNVDFRQLRISYPVNNQYDFIGNEVGDVSTNAGGVIATARAFMLTYHVQYIDDRIFEHSKVWMDEVKDRVLEMEELGRYELAVATTDSLDDELNSISVHVVPLFAAAYAILCVFSMITCMMVDWIRSQMWVALGGQVSTALAIVSGMGLMVAVGVPFASITSTMPFLLMGIGIDNMFVLVGVWRETSIRASVRERMEDTLKRGAVSITVTSLTDILAFAIGIISPFRSVQFFCAYCAVACAFCYVYSITFVVACLVYAGRAEENNRHIITCCTLDPIITAEKKEDRGCMWRFFCWGSAVHHETNDKSNQNGHIGKTLASIPDIIVPYATKIIYYPLSWFMLKGPVKVLILLSYCVYLGFAIYGCLNIGEGLLLQNLAPDYSYLGDFYPKYDALFGGNYGGRIIVTIDQPLDYTNIEELAKVDALVRSFQNDKHFVNDESMLEFWLTHYQTYISRFNINIQTMHDFITHLRVFLRDPFLERFSTDVTFNANYTEIIAARFLIQSYGVESAEEERDLVVRCQELTDESDLKAFAYFRAFIYWYQYVIITRTTLTNLAIAVACVIVVAFLLIPSFSALIMVTISIVSITVGVVGYMSLWGVNLDSVSMINLVMCIGFSVDFSAHICYHFSAALEKDIHFDLNENEKEISSRYELSTVEKQNGLDNPAYATENFVYVDSNATKYPKPIIIDDYTRGNQQVTKKEKPPTRLSGNEKARRALTQLGLPIFQGAASTILALAILASAGDYIHRTFFKTIFLVMVFGFYHAMLLIPSFLSTLDNIFTCCRRKIMEP